MRILFRNKKFINLFGWSGSCTILLAYGLNSYGLTDNKILLNGLNMYGSFSLGLICFQKKIWQPFFLELIWFMIAGSAMGHNLFSD